MGPVEDILLCFLQSQTSMLFSTRYSLGISDKASPTPYAQTKLPSEPKAPLISRFLQCHTHMVLPQRRSGRRRSRHKPKRRCGAQREGCEPGWHSMVPRELQRSDGHDLAAPAEAMHDAVTSSRTQPTPFLAPPALPCLPPAPATPLHPVPITIYSSKGPSCSLHSKTLLGKNRLCKEDVEASPASQQPLPGTEMPL